MHSVWIVDEDATYCAWIAAHVGAILPDAEIEMPSPLEFEERVGELAASDVDLVLLVASFGENPDDPASPGLASLRRLRDAKVRAAVVTIAASGNELTAVRALRLGAVDYLPKALATPARLSTSLKLALRALARRSLPRTARTRKSDRARKADPPKPARPRFAATLPMQRDLLPRYEIREIVGESDRAVVYLAHSLDLDALVALKVSRVDENAPEDETPAHFAQEYEAICALAHRAIVDIHDYGVHGGLEYLAMEYFPRGDLKSRMRAPLDVELALAYAYKIAEALDVVHAAGLIHRDLKPPNVMLRENDDIVLIDFGLARAFDATSTATRTGMLRGSPYYMSPEQAQGLPLDPRTDLYSLGIMFFEMLAGRKPYVGNSAIELLQQHVHAPVPRLPDEFARFQPIIEKALAKQPAERYASGTEFSAALASATDDETRDTPAPAPGPAPAPAPAPAPGSATASGSDSELPATAAM